MYVEFGKHGLLA